ncbi:MAG: crossover junction endodeoxyribonuclease RuvC [Oscillospiraceae bacterium]|nr:crossover junction endodeoxyribonuclease RuvC [Oscillospiraceae bacterium]
MRIVGIDPGYAIVGFGVVDYANNAFRMCEYGAVTTEAHTPFDRRLLEIDAGLAALLARAKPDALAIEKLYFNSNQKTAIDVAQARGVCVLAAVKAGVPVFEYTPLQVKMSVVGYGRAEKKQVMEMTRIMLGLEKVPKPDDAADALAIAICHAHSAVSRMGNLYLQNRGRY